MPLDRPNIIFIITDQQRYDTIRALGFDYMDTPHLDRLVREGVVVHRLPRHRRLLRPGPGQPVHGLLSAHHRHPQERRPLAADLDRTAQRRRLSLHQHRQDAHLAVRDAELGFHERYVVENKDRYLEGRYYFDEWDKALRSRGLVKQQRELYRKLPDYRERLGAFEWELPEDTHPDMFVGDMARLVDRHLIPRREPLFLQIGFPGPHPPYDPVPRYAEPYLKKDLPLLEVTAGRAGQPAAAVQGNAACTTTKSITIRSCIELEPDATSNGIASGPTTWPT